MEIKGITKEQKNAVFAVYTSLYDEYMRWYRKRPKNSYDKAVKKFALKHWKEHLLNLQIIIRDVLKIDATFKEFKGE